MDTPMSDI